MQAKMYRIFAEEEALAIREQVMAMEWKQGQARTPELTGSIKQNLEVKPEEGPEAKALSAHVTQRVLSNMEVTSDCLPAKSTAMKFNKYGNTGAYHRHTDAPFMGPVRTDFACTLFLTDPSNYVGGDLHIEDGIGGQVVVRGNAGEAFVYECGRAHWVDPVTEGDRVCAVGWIQSHFPDPMQRELLRGLRHVTREMESVMKYNDPNDLPRKWFVDIGQVHSGLFRYWST